MIDEHDKVSGIHLIAWAAGFVDGEGCIHILKQKYLSNGEVKYNHVLMLHIAQNNLEVLERFKSVVGIHGNIHN